MSQFNTTVVDYPKKHLIGMKMRTTMEKAATDCPVLWQTFGPRLESILAEDCQGSYGICVMLDMVNFDYWAAVEYDPSLDLPEGLDRYEISAGPYARASVPNLEKMGPAYMYLYEEWPKSQSGYIINMQAPGFEFYPPNWQPNEPLEIYVPLIKA